MSLIEDLLGGRNYGYGSIDNFKTNRLVGTIFNNRISLMIWRVITVIWLVFLLKGIDVYENYQKYNDISSQIVTTGVIHVYDSFSVQDSPNSPTYTRSCYGISTNNHVIMEDQTPEQYREQHPAPSNRCPELANIMPNWKQYKIVSETSVIKDLAQAVILIAFCTFSLYYLFIIVIGIPVIVLKLNTFVQYVAPMSFSMALCISIFVATLGLYSPSSNGYYWNYNNMGLVSAHEVYVLEDGSVYNRPNSLLSWAFDSIYKKTQSLSPETVDKLKK